MSFKNYFQTGLITLITLLATPNCAANTVYGQEPKNEPARQEQKADETKQDKEKAKEFYKSGLENLENIKKLYVEKDILTEDKQKISELEKKIKELDNKTIQNFEAVTGTDKDILNAIIGLADTNYERNRYDKAIELYQKAIKKDDKNADLYFKIGFSLAELGKFDDAFKWYEKAKELKPDLHEKTVFQSDAAKKLHLSGMKNDKNNLYDAALDDFKKALEIELNPVIVYQMGWTLRKKGDRAKENGDEINARKQYDAAIALYKLAIKMQPACSPSEYGALGGTHHKLQMPRGCILYNRICLLFKPDSPYKEELENEIASCEKILKDKR